jgi:hypothetical protein
MATRLIDVWDVETFDEDLLGKLRARAELVRNYIVTNREILESEASGLTLVYRSNSYSQSYHRLLEQVDRDMETRTIRAWHYTRLTDAEFEAMQTTGIKLSSLEAIRQRFNMQVAAKEISADTADALYAASPFHHPRADRAALRQILDDVPSGGDWRRGCNPAPWQLGRRGGVLLAK